MTTQMSLPDAAMKMWVYQGQGKEFGRCMCPGCSGARPTCDISIYCLKLPSKELTICGKCRDYLDCRTKILTKHHKTFA
jgi:hypothetical protein